MTTSRNLKVLGVTVNVFLDRSATGGQYSCYQCEVPYQVGPPPHTHPAFDEGFVVSAGEVDVLLDGKWKTLGVGESVFVPRGAVHTFRGASLEPAVFVGIATPGGHEEFFYDMDAVTEPNQDSIMAVLTKHGIYPA